jgi:murein DD-endopeptidase MepM/ murein hydrolase activator NlpD
VGVERRGEAAFAKLVTGWQRSARAAATALSTTDGRWAFVSTSVTALVAGSIAWLAAGIMPPSSQQMSGGNDRSLMPYQLFMRLAAAHAHSAGGYSYAAFGSTDLGPTTAPTGAPPASLDNALANERAGIEDSGSETDTRTITLDRGDTLAGALTDAGVSSEDANAAVLAMAKVYDMRDMRAGESFDISFTTVPDKTVTAQITYTPPGAALGDSVSDDDTGDGAVEDVPATPIGKLLSLSYSPSVDHEITVTRAATGGFTASDVRKKLEARYHRAGATIDSSLYLAAMQAGIPADVVVQMIHMFSYEVDFQRDIRPGNSFEVFYNYYYTPEGQPAKQGDIAYAEMHLAGRTIALYRYHPNGDAPDYFDAHGQSARSMLMKTPVDGARITSGFGMRFHPILGYTRMHKGIDFGVPTGTPVMAAGSGVIKQEGWSNGYGKLLVIDHQNNYATAYGHLSRFAPGLHVGSRVRQGQVVAYSGMTGMATGPHLHYEIRIGGNQVNPASVKVATGRRLFGRDLRDFLVERLHIDSELASMPLESKVAEGGGELRAMRD